MLTPLLRFKGFTDKWDLVSLSNVTNSLEYGLNAAAKEFDGENQYIRITDIDEETRRYLKCGRVSPDGELEEKYLLQKGDLLFARTGASTGKTYLYREEDGKIYYAGFLIRAKVKEEVNPMFIFLQTFTSSYNKWVKVMSMRSGQPGINATEYGSYRFYIPTLEEQQKIADFFTLLNRRIEKQQEKVEALREYKKGMLQKIFSRELRFKDESGKEFPEWEYKRLNNFAEKITRKNKGFLIKNVISNSSKFGLIPQKDYFDKDIANKDNIDGYYVISKGDFVYNPRISNDAPYGPVSTYMYDEEGVVSPLYLCFKVEGIEKDFLSYFFKSDLWYKHIYLNGDSGARHDRVSIKDKEFFELRIPFPCIKEQQKIADFLSKLDEKIEKEESKLESFQEQKKGFMQQMFI